MVGVVLATGLLLGGCAFTEGQIPVHYIAPPNLEVVDGAKTVNVVVKGQDNRVSNRDRIGTKKNGYGMEAARITSQNNVVELVRGAVEQELQSLGFKTGPGGLTVKVELETFYNDFKSSLFNLDAVAEVAFTVTALNPDGSYVYSKSYRAVGTNPSIFMATPESAEPALERALTQSMATLVQDEKLHRALITAGQKLAGAPGMSSSPPVKPVVPPPAAQAAGQVASLSKPTEMPGPDACKTDSAGGGAPFRLASTSASDPLPSVISFQPAPVSTLVCLDTGGYFAVRSISGNTVHTVNAARSEAEWVGLFFTPTNRAQEFDRAAAESIWPLEIGKSVSFKITGTGASGSLGAWQETITVVRQEDLTTEAGQFRTMVVETREQSLTGPFQAVATRWYSPDIGFVVKYRRVIEQGSGNESAWTASRIMRPGN
jgi:uncharacterized lipoprotein